MNKAWYCIAHNPTRWVYGESVGVLGAEIHNIQADIVRLSNGSWQWRLSQMQHPPVFGIEPTGDLAAETAIKELNKHVN